MAYYSRSHYGAPAEEPFPALYGGFIAVSELPYGVYGSSPYGGGSYGASALLATDAPALASAIAFTDGVASTDAAALLIAKAIADGIAGSEAIAKHVEKPLFEPDDTYGLGVYGFSEYGGGGSLQATDAIAKAIGKPIADGAEVADALAKAVALAVADGVDLADVVTKAVDKVIADGVDVDDLDIDVLLLMILTLLPRSTILHTKERLP